MRRIIPPLAVTLFALFAAQPLVVNQLTCSDDSAFHIGRAVNLEALIDSGHFFPRWSPYMAHGYGYPFFNYYAPLSSYLLVAIHKLGFIYPVAFHIALFLCLWLAGLATYAIAREWWGQAGGVVSAAVYLTSPYFAYDLLFRGNLAESFALLWPPLILFTLHRALNNQLLITNHRIPSSVLSRLSFGFWDFGIWDLLASASVASLLLTHNATALAAAPLFAGYIALLALRQRDWRTLSRGAVIILFGFALAAYFWLPALAETNLVQTDKLLVPPIFTYYTNFLSLGELLAPPAVIDPLLINPSPPKALSLVIALLAFVGFAKLIANGRWPTAISAALQARNTQGAIRDMQYVIRNMPSATSHLPLAIWLLAFGIFYSALTLSLSQPLWDHLPLIKFIQFPWRLLAPATLCAALLAGAIIPRRSGLNPRRSESGFHPRHPWITASLLSLTAALASLSWWYPRYCAPFNEATLTTTLQYELDTNTLGTTAKGEFLPRTARFVPEDQTLADALIRGEQPQYLTGLPVDSILTLFNPDPLNYRAAVTLTSPSTLTFNQFLFPGWVVRLDDQPLDITPTPDTGLITFPLPAGSHILHIQFTNTPVRTLASLISLISLISFISLLAYRLRHSSPTNYQHRPHPAFGGAYAQRCGLPITNHVSRLSFLVCLLPLALLLLRPLLFDRTSNLLLHSAFDGETIQLGQPLNAHLASGLIALSAEHPSSIPSGADFDANLYLTALEHTDRQFRPRFDLVSPDGLLWNTGNDALPPRWHREPPETSQWPLGQYAQWARRQTVLPGTPPGDYELRAIVFDRATLAPESLIDENGNPVSPVIALGTIHVTRPAAPPALPDLNIEHRTEHSFGPITLLGYNLDRAEARPGDSVLITLFLRANNSITNYQSPISNLQFNIFTPSYPTSSWQPGDIWRFQTIQRIPADAPSGPYRFTLSLIDTDAPSLDLVPIHLTAPDRIFTPPPIATPTSIRFGNSIDLTGYDLQITNNQLLITLLWHALATPDSDLLAFVHFEDSSGRIVAQSDSVPANWSRPTTGWVGGEYILDPRSLPILPTGTYNLFIGLADRVSGARLPTSDGDRALIGVYKAP